MRRRRRLPARAAIGLLMAAGLLAGAGRAWALSGAGVRYALVIGNNQGNAPAVTLDKLRHAEREALRLRDSLVRYGNFDEERVVVVVGGGRHQILEAAQRLAAKRQQDRAEVAELPTLFALFFTGHGLAGQLLTADVPLSGEDLGEIFRSMDATLTVGFFDACYAGSIDLDTLRGKGVTSTPGFNPVAALPAEVLNAAGTLWFVSSRPDEVSYEDDALGGLFTHFFIEAFTQAPENGVGVSLDDMWEHARERTQSYAARYGRTQHPEKFVRHLKASGPLYFSFPEARDARLVFDPEVEGTFLLNHTSGALVERVVKTKGRALDVPMYAGEITVSRVQGADLATFPTQRLLLAKGGVAHVRRPNGALPVRPPGFAETPIHGKGELPDIVVTTRESEALLDVGVGYRFAPFQQDALGVEHAATLAGWYAYGPYSLGLGLAYGRMSEQRTSWSYTLQEADVLARAGLGMEVASVRVDLEASAGFSLYDLSYGTGDGRRPQGALLGAAVHGAWAMSFAGGMLLHARAGAVARYSQGLSFDDRTAYWTLCPIIEVSASLPVIGGATGTN